MMATAKISASLTNPWEADVYNVPVNLRSLCHNRWPFAPLNGPLNQSLNQL